MNPAIELFSLLQIKKNFYAISIAWIATAGLVAQETENTNPNQDALAEKLLAIKTFQASFAQVAITQDGDTEASQSGRILFDRTGKFLWEVTEPFEQFILVSEDTMRVFDPDLEQLTISSFDATSSTTFASLILTSSTEILEEFDIAFENDQYTLSPKKQGYDFVRLNIIFQQDTLSSIEILDHFNTINQFKFSDLETNKPIASDEFLLDIPDGTEVIDQRVDTEEENADYDD